MSRIITFAAALALAVSSFAAVEFPVSDAVLENPPGYRSAISAGSDGDGFLAAWIDTRSIEPVLYVARLTRGGEILDPAGIPIARRSVGRPQVIWNGERYLVFWNASQSIMVAEVERDGSVSAPRIVLADAQLDPFRGTSVATNGSWIMIAYADPNGFNGWGEKAYAAVLTRDAVLFRYFTLDFADPAWNYKFQYLQPTVVATPSQFLVAWNVQTPEQTIEVKGVRFNAGGAPLDSIAPTIGTAGQAVSIVRNGTDYVVLSRHHSWGVGGDLQSVSPAVMHDFVTTAGSVPFQRNGRATVLGVDWSDGASGVPSAIQFNQQGHVATREPLPLAVPGGTAVASNGNEVVVLSGGTEYGITSEPVLARLFNISTLQPVTEAVALTGSAARQESPAVAADDSGFLVAWHEPNGIHAGRLLQNGVRRDGRGIQLAPGGQNGLPAAVFDGRQYVVAFPHTQMGGHSEVFVRFISPSEGLLPNVIRISAPHVSEVVMATNGEFTLLVWSNEGRLHAVRIDQSMQMMDVPLALPAFGTSPAVAWNGQEFLLAWSDIRFDFDFVFHPRLGGLRIGRNLNLIDTTSRVLAETPGMEHVDPALTWNGNVWVVAWTSYQWPLGTSPSQVRIEFIDGEGNPIRITGTPLATGRNPQITRAGSRVWLAWKELDGGPLQLARLTHIDALDETGQQTIDAPTPLDFQWPEHFAMISRGEQLIVAFPRIAGTEVGALPRVFLSLSDRINTRRRSVR